MRKLGRKCRESSIDVQMMERNFYLKQVISKMWDGNIKTITGIRRCGKSTSLFDLFYSYFINNGVKEECVIKNELDVSLKDSFVARYGGEEFIVVIKMNNDFNSVYNVIEDLRKVMEKNEFLYNDLKLKLTITTGLKQYQDNLEIDEWINQADKLLYQGKNSGKNKTVI